MPLRYDNSPLLPSRGKPSVDPRTTLRARCDAAIAQADATLARCAAVLADGKVAAARHATASAPSRARQASQASQERSDARPDPVAVARRQMIADSHNAWRESKAAVTATGHNSGHNSNVRRDAMTAHGSAAGEREAWSAATSAVDKWRRAAESTRDESTDEDEETAEAAETPPEDEMHGDGRSNGSNGDTAEDAYRKMLEDSRNAWRGDRR